MKSRKCGEDKAYDPPTSTKNEETTLRPRKEKKKSKNKFGSLFKPSQTQTFIEENSMTSGDNGNYENSDEYWDEQRAKLGLKPLKK